MTFPTVVDVTTGADPLNTTSHVVTLPGSITAGQRLIISIGNTTNADTTWPSGWNELYDSGIVGAQQAGAYRDCDGSEAATITVGTASSFSSAWAIVRLAAGSFVAANPPAVGTAASGSSAAPNPPNDAPSWSTDDVLWIAVCSGSTTPPLSINAYPTNYGSNQTFINAASAANNGWLALATRNLNAASENPGTFTLSQIDDWIAQTIAVRGQAPITGTGSVSLAALTMSASGTIGPAYDARSDLFAKGYGGKFREFRRPGGRRR